MRKIYKKHWKKFLLFGLIKKAILLFFLFHSSLFASGTYSGIYFTDYEENATVYLCNYYQYAHFKDLRITATTSKNLVNDRKNQLYTSVTDIDNVSGISGTQLAYLRQDSHLIDWNKYTNDYGMTLQQTSFMYALLGSLIGIVWLFFFIYMIVRK
jgi:hypothetical protein